MPEHATLHCNPWCKARIAAVNVPDIVKPKWTTPDAPEFWSVVQHADQVYGRTEAGIVRWIEGARRWYSVKTNPHDRYCFGLAAGPTSLAPLYAMEGNFLFVSRDGCRSWERRTLPLRPVTMTQSAIATDPHDDLTLYLFGQQGTLAQAQHAFFWTHDAGRTWEGPVAIGQTTTAFNPVTHNLLVLPKSPTSGGIFMATPFGIYKAAMPAIASDAAQTLLELPASDTRAIHAMAVGSGHPTTNPVAVATVHGLEHHIQVSDDGGANWPIRNPYPHKFFIDDLIFADNLLFAKLTHSAPEQKPAGAVLMSRDHGATWIDITPPGLEDQLVLRTNSPFPREGLAYASDQLYLMSFRVGVHSIPLAALGKL
jgi:hypothetical protein